MKERKTGRIIILCAFVIIICCSKGIWFFTEKFIDSDNYENREMAARPSLTLDSYGAFSADFTRYFNDNLQFRNVFIQLNSYVDYFGFRRSSNEEVIVGNDNWLFYDNIGDGDPIGCYRGTKVFSDEELNEIAQNCIKQRDFLLEQGKEFIIFIAPNKERVYSEYMPDRYGKPADNYGALQIYDYLKTNTDLRVVYPYEDLMSAKEKIEENIWSKTDTHWNYLGGYVGATALLSELGIKMPPIYSEEITINANGNTAGDLADMLNLHKQLEFADRDYSVEGYNTHDSECIEWDFSGMWRFHAINADSRKIYVIRDSFSSHMAKFIGSQFNDSYLRHRESYSYDDFISCNPDIVVLETVERYVDTLASFSIQ